MHWLVLAFLALVAADRVELLESEHSEAFRRDYTVLPEWRVFSADQHAILEMKTILSGEVQAKFAQPVVISGPDLAVEDVTDCEETMGGVCTQNWYFRTEDVAQDDLEGVVAVRVGNKNGMVYNLRFSYLVTIEAPSTIQQLLTAGGLPVISRSLEGAIPEGSEMCVQLRSENEISVRAARTCASLSENLAALSGQDSGCASPLADVVSDLFYDSEQNIALRHYNPVLRQTRDPLQWEFCFNAKKLSMKGHLLELSFNAPGLEKRYHWGWSAPHSFNVDCVEDLEFDPGSLECTVESPAHGPIGWIWFWVFIGLVLLCCLFVWVVVGCDGWWSTPYDEVVYYNPKQTDSSDSLAPLTMDPADIAHYIGARRRNQ